MDLAINLLLIMLTELPIIGFFFRKRKRRFALGVGFFANIITWPIVNIIRLNTDWNLNMVAIGVVIAEGIAYYFLLGRNMKKAILITLIANGVSFFVLKYVPINPDSFQKKTDIIH
jgi:hypothetical protein